MAPDPNSASGSGTKDEASVKVPAKDPKKKDDKKDEDLVGFFLFCSLFGHVECRRKSFFFCVMLMLCLVAEKIDGKYLRKG